MQLSANFKRLLVFAKLRNYHSLVIICFASIFLAKLGAIGYGRPFLFHPDEACLYKDPVKLLYNYSQFDFSSSTNLFFWVVPIWYGFVFVFGLMTHQWQNFHEFKELLILEDFSIIYYGRFLSIVFSLAGSYLMWKVIDKVNLDNKIKVILLLSVLLNPFELISNLWFKFDAACYFYSCFLLYHTYIFFNDAANVKRKNRLYIILFIAPAIRIDLVAFPLSFVIYDIVKNYNFRIIAYLKNCFKIICIGVFIYSLITLLPIGFFVQPTDETILVEKTFEKLISSKVIENIGYNLILNTIANSFYYYFVFCFVFILPVVAFILIKFFKKISSRFLFITIAVIASSLLIYGYNAPHYFLIISTIFLFLFITNLENLFTSKKSITIFSLCNFLYISSISITFFIYIYAKQDPRIAARDYILQNTSKNDLIAMEGYINIGQSPPIEEYPEVLLKRAEITKRLRMGTGESLLRKAKKVNPEDRRRILDISSPKRFVGTEYENIWNNNFDVSTFNKALPKFAVFGHNQKNETSEFSRNVIANYELVRTFSINFSDIRVKKLLQKENYFPDIYVYRKKRIGNG